MATPSGQDPQPTASLKLPRFTVTPLAAGALALALVALLAAWAHLPVALQRPSWLDEIVGQLIASDPRGLWHGMRTGADFQPPVHYALMRIADTVGGGATPAAARWPSVLAAILTIGMFTAALRPSLSVAAAMAGALALAAHPLFLSQAIEARPYALWIFATVLTAEALRDGRRSRPWLLAVSAAVLCTAHYFGILSLTALGIGLLVAGLARHRPRAELARSATPLLAGVIALGALLPLARVQLAATGGRSWVPPATMRQVADFLEFPWGWRPAALLILAGALVAVVRRLPIARPLPLVTPPRPVWSPVVLALLATALVPLLVVGVSLAYKPVLVLRYAAPATLAVATLTAIAVEALPAPARWLAVLWLVRATAFSFSSTAAAASTSTLQFADEQRALRHLGTLGIATVSPFRHDAYAASAPQGATPVAWIELSDALIERAARTPAAGLSRDFLLVERDFGRAVHRAFDFPLMESAEALNAAPVVALLRAPVHAAADSLWLPGRQACPLSNRLVVYSLPSAPVACADLQAALQADSRR